MNNLPYTGYRLGIDAVTAKVDDPAGCIYMCVRAYLSRRIIWNNCDDLYYMEGTLHACIKSGRPPSLDHSRRGQRHGKKVFYHATFKIVEYLFTFSANILDVNNKALHLLRNIIWTTGDGLHCVDDKPSIFTKKQCPPSFGLFSRNICYNRHFVHDNKTLPSQLQSDFFCIDLNNNIFS